MNFFQFLHGLICDSLNDNKSANWLPDILDKLTNADTGEKFFPLKMKYTENYIKESGEVVQNMLCAIWLRALQSVEESGRVAKFHLKDYNYIPDPEQKHPLLKLTDIVIDGLTNTRLSENALHTEHDSGYYSEMTAQFDAYPGRPGVRIYGKYELCQRYCAADLDYPAGGACPTQKQFTLPYLTWPYQDIISSGDFAISVCLTDNAQTAAPEVRLVIDTSIDGSGGTRRLVETVTELKLTADEGKTVTFLLDEDSLTVNVNLGKRYSTLTKNAVITAFDDPASDENMLAVINSLLAENITGV